MSNPLVAYQVACGYSLIASQMGDKAEVDSPPTGATTQSQIPTQSQILGAAMKWYVYSVQTRPDIADIAKTDPDIAWLRSQPQFAESSQPKSKSNE